MLVALLFAASLGAAPQAATVPAQPDPKIIRVFVQTDEGGDAAEHEARRESVKHLQAALADKKKANIGVAIDEAGADVLIEVQQRSVTVPKVVIGLSGGMGSPNGRPGMAPAPVRVVKLDVTIAITRDSDPVKLANKNRANETESGWKSAAEDVAKQVEKWIADHRAAIIAARVRKP